MEEFVTKDRANYYLGITSITVIGKAAYELKGKFLYDLRENAFSGTNEEDAVEHIEYFLKIVDPIDLPNVNYEQLRLAVFPISLVRNASKWFEEYKGSITTWVDLIDKFFAKYYPPSHTCNTVGTEAKRDLTNTISFGNFHELDYELLVKLQECWWKINDHECSPFGNWRDHIHGPYTNINTTHDPYLDGRNGRACKNNDNQEKEEQHKEGRCYLFDDPARKLPVCKIRRFKMIKYSFGHEEEYVAIKEYEYNHLTRTNEDACHAYQEIFRNMDEGWLMTRAE
ncbi:hypothetical protein Tco_0568412 [Tanacetum coccineum]